MASPDESQGTGFRNVLIIGAVLALIAAILVPFLFLVSQLATLIYVETPEEAAEVTVSRNNPDANVEHLEWRKKRISADVVELTAREPREREPRGRVFRVRVRNVWGLGWELLEYETRDLK